MLLSINKIGKDGNQATTTAQMYRQKLGDMV